MYVYEFEEIFLFATEFHLFVDTLIFKSIFILAPNLGNMYILVITSTVHS